MLVFDATDDQSFQNMRGWVQTIQQHGAGNVAKVLVATKCDRTSERQVDASRAQSLADEFGMPFFETSAANNHNVVAAFTTLAANAKQRMGNNAYGAGQQQQQQAAGGFGGMHPQGHTANAHTSADMASLCFCF